MARLDARTSSLGFRTLPARVSERSEPGTHSLDFTHEMAGLDTRIIALGFIRSMARVFNEPGIALLDFKLVLAGLDARIPSMDFNRLLARVSEEGEPSSV